MPDAFHTFDFFAENLDSAELYRESPLKSKLFLTGKHEVVLFPNAKIAKDFIQHVLDINRAKDAAQRPSCILQFKG